MLQNNMNAEIQSFKPHLEKRQRQDFLAQDLKTRQDFASPDAHARYMDRRVKAYKGLELDIPEDEQEQIALTNVEIAARQMRDDADKPEVVADALAAIEANLGFLRRRTNSSPGSPSERADTAA